MVGIQAFAQRANLLAIIKAAKPGLLAIIKAAKPWSETQIDFIL